MIYLGHVGENHTRDHTFPIGHLMDKYPDCVPAVMHRRPNDSEAKPVESISIVGRSLVWLFDSYDTAQQGQGECWLVMKSADGETVWMSDKIDTDIKQGLPNWPVPALMVNG